MEKFPPYSVPTMKESRESCEMMDPRESKAARSALVPDAPLPALLELRGFSPPAGRSPALVPRSFATASFCSADIAPPPPLRAQRDPAPGALLPHRCAHPPHGRNADVLRGQLVEAYAARWQTRE